MAEINQKEEMQREKNKQLARERDRKTSLIFQKKNLKGTPFTTTLTQTLPS